MNDMEQSLTVTLYGREYSIRCAPHEVDTLRRAASYLDRMMHNIATTQELVSIDKIAVISALTVAFEHVEQNSQANKDSANVDRRLKKLLEKMESALTYQEELEV